MAKTATETVTKSATKAANNKTRVKADKPVAAEKTKRAPSAYQIFCKENMKKWNENNPGRAKEAMTQIALLWKDAPENPNRGQEPKARKPKTAKEPKESKAKAKPRTKKAKKADTDEEAEDAENSERAEASNDDDEE